MAPIDGGRLLGDRYVLRRQIAAGGMGAVWEAEDRLLDRQVAVKLPSEALAQDERFVERFRREARAAAALSDPNIAAVLDYGEDDGIPFIVMELLRGETLAQRLLRGPMPLEEAVGVSERVAAALDAAHQAGIVHRDVKPANVMLTEDGGVKVMDFGIAAASWAPRITASGTTIGTATYLSPEQAAGQAVTPASDVYSLAVMAYEMLAGDPPFAGETPVAVAAAHVNAPPPPLREAAPHVPQQVAAAIERALAKDPRERPHSAGAFADELTGERAAQAAPVVGLGERTEVIAPSGTAVLPSVEPPGRERVRSGRRTGDPPIRQRWGWILLGALFGLGLLGSILASVFVAQEGSRPPSRQDGPSPSPLLVEVPDVRGLHVEDARAALGQKGFEVVDVQPVDGPEGIVQASEPQPHTLVRPGTPVTLYVGALPTDDDDDTGGPGRGNSGKGKGRGGGDD